MKRANIYCISQVLRLRKLGVAWLGGASSESLKRLLLSFYLGLPLPKGSNGAENSIPKALMWLVVSLCSSLIIGQKVQISPWKFLHWTALNIIDCFSHSERWERKRERERKRKRERWKPYFFYNLISETVDFTSTIWYWSNRPTLAQGGEITRLHSL